MLQGGLWAKGVFKEGTEEQPLITVITVVLNGQNSIQNTIENIRNQTYQHIELIVIDGGSQDQTIEIIQSLDSKIDHWISEKDSGIYDAMNKGINLARGKWLNFMNCGDKFYNEKVLTNIFETLYIKPKVGPIIYGNQEVRYSTGKSRIAHAGIVDDLWKGSQFCHQSVFIPISYHKSHLYNLGFPIAADFEFFFNALRNGVKFEKIDIIISSIEAGGVSDTKRVEVIKSWWQVVGKGLRTDLYFCGRIVRELIVKRVKTLIKW